MAMKRQTEKFASNCNFLVQSVAEFDEKDKNFQISVDFVLSNLLYHTYPDVNPYAVKEKISRLKEKYVIHSDLERARAFQSVTEKLIHLFENKCPEMREDGYKVMEFLLNLSESGDVLNNYRKPQTSSCISEESEPFDWASYLREDFINNNALSDSSSEISLSEQGSTNESPTSEDDSLKNLPDPLLRPPPRDDSGLGISPDSASGTSQHFHLAQLHQEYLPSAVKSEKNPETFYPYWITKYQRVYGSSPYDNKNMNFTKVWNEYMLKQNLFALIERKVVVHERNVIREILWMLIGVKDLFVIQWNGEKFIANSQVHLCNLTSNTLSVVLNYFCEYGTKVAVLRDFLHNALMNRSEHCRTYRAYAYAVQEQMQKISASVCKLDKGLRKGGGICTLLSLQQQVEFLFHEIDLLSSIHEDVSAVLSDTDERRVRACRLLHTLWKLLYHYSVLDQKSPSQRIVLKIFLKTCRPYFSFLEELIILGSFRDPFGEFIVKRDDINVTDEAFWEKGFGFQPIPPDVEEEFFLKLILTDILSAAKSLEILNSINYSFKKEPFRLEAEKGDMYTKFIKVLQRLLCGRRKQIPSSRAENLEGHVSHGCVVPKDPLLEPKIFAFNPNTAKFFQPDVNPAYRIVTSKVREKLFSESYLDLERTMENLEMDTLKPLSKCFNKALDTCMKFAYYPVCRRLVCTLKDDFVVVSHLSIMRKYFLMEAGDLMFSFYSEVFDKIFYKEPWLDVSFLYSALQNALSEENEASNLSLFLDKQNSEIRTKQPLSLLHALQLSYQVEWPVSLLLGNKAQNEYCQIFSFLLQIKCAKYLLDGLYCIGLGKQKSQSQLIRMRSKFPREQKIHGMYVIRMKLMFFVNGLHNYIMTRILHSFGVEFMELLDECASVAELLSTHEGYLRSLQERCLLDRRISYLKEHIFHVLNLCHALQQAWIKGIDKIKLEELQQIENQFSEYSNFLFNCFNTSLRRGNNPLLESLVSTMLSNAHTLHVFALEDS